MKKAIKILLRIAKPLSIVYGIAFLLASLALIIVGLVFLFSDLGAAEQGYGDLVLAAIIYLSIGAAFVPAAVICFVNAAIVNKTYEIKTKTQFILNIVFGFMTVEVNGVAGILGLIAYRDEI